MTMLPSWHAPDRDDDLVDTAAIEVRRGPRAGTWIHVAPWGRRAAAAAIDGVPGFALVGIGLVHLKLSTRTEVVTRSVTDGELGFPSGDVVTVTDTVTTVPQSAWVVLAVMVGAALLLWVLNQVLLQRRDGRSLGKRVLGLQLVDVRDGEPVTGFAAVEWGAAHDGRVFQDWSGGPGDHTVLGDTVVALARRSTPS